MAMEPTEKRVFAFFDGQNLFHRAEDAFGYTHPNFDPEKLAEMVCREHGWRLAETRFYTGIPPKTYDAFWHGFWTNKLAAMKRRGMNVFSRHLRIRSKTIRLDDGTEATATLPVEKGIDVRIAIDIMRLTYQRLFDVALIFSQDQDLSEVAKEVRDLARVHDRWIKLASAYPFSASANNTKGIDGTDWIRIEKASYDTCLDPVDYRPTAAGQQPMGFAPRRRP